MYRSGLVGKFAPIALLIWVLADILLRFIPPERLRLDPWMVVSRFPARYSPFSANRHFYLSLYLGGNALFHDDPEGLPELDWLLTHLPARPSTVVYTYLEHERFSSPDDTHGWQGVLIRKDPKLEGDLRYLKLLNTFFWELAPTKVITTR